MDKAVRVWNVRGECEAIFDFAEPPTSTLVFENTLFVTCGSNSMAIYVFDWNIS